MSKRSFKVMDCDIHVREPEDLWTRYIEPDFRDRAPIREKSEGTDALGRWRSDGKMFPAFIEDADRTRNARIRIEKAKVRHKKLGREPPAPDEGTTPSSMLAAMDLEGIDTAIVFRTMAAHLIAIDGMDPELSAALCRAFNAWLREFCDADSARLKLAALMPMHDVDVAVLEARRAVTELGAISLVLPNNPVNERPWYDLYYEPFWGEAERLGVPVSFHGIQMAYQQHLGRRFMDNFPLVHAAAHPMEMQLAMGAMIVGGVLARHEGLTAAFLEGHCSWLPSLLYILDERQDKFGDEERFGTKLSPTEYFLRQCYASVDVDEEPVKYVIDSFGDENLVISTDWPHDDSSYPQAINTFLALPNVSDESKRKILWDNCARLYNLA
jgi:predicted TIM-barrel fold metal-dependent hydrolase